MHVRRFLLFSGAVAALSLAAHAQTSPNDAMQTCKNVASDRLPNVPRAFISVQRGSNTGDGSFMINWRAQPPNNRPASGFCIVNRWGKLQNFQFDAPSPGGRPPSGGGRISPSDAMLACQNEASNRLPGVPRAFISTFRATDPGDNSYVINWRVQPPNNRPQSGFCNIAWNGAVRNFQFDRPMPPPPPPGNGGDMNFGGRDPQEAMRSCKATVSQRFQNVPLAYIQVDPPRVNGGSLLSVWRVQAPGVPRASGTCDVFGTGRVNLTINR